MEKVWLKNVNEQDKKAICCDSKHRQDTKMNKNRFIRTKFTYKNLPFTYELLPPFQLDYIINLKKKNNKKNFHP